MLGPSGMGEESELVVADPFNMDGDSTYQEPSALKKWVTWLCVCVCVKQRPLKNWLWAELYYNRHFTLSHLKPLKLTKVVAVKENVPLISQMCWLGIQPWVILLLFMFCTFVALVLLHLSLVIGLIFRRKKIGRLLHYYQNVFRIIVLFKYWCFQKYFK